MCDTNTSGESNSIETQIQEYKKRRKIQMAKFFGATILTMISFKFLLKGFQKPKYIPKLFDFNHKTAPKTIQQRDMKSSLFGTMGITTGGMLMTIFGTCWTMDISTMKDFNKKFHGLDETSNDQLIE